MFFFCSTFQNQGKVSLHIVLAQAVAQHKHVKCVCESKSGLVFFLSHPLHRKRK